MNRRTYNVVKVSDGYIVHASWVRNGMTLGNTLAIYRTRAEAQRHASENTTMENAVFDAASDPEAVALARVYFTDDAAAKKLCERFADVIPGGGSLPAVYCARRLAQWIAE